MLPWILLINKVCSLEHRWKRSFTKYILILLYQACGACLSPKKLSWVSIFDIFYLSWQILQVLRWTPLREAQRVRRHFSCQVKILLKHFELLQLIKLLLCQVDQPEQRPLYNRFHIFEHIPDYQFGLVFL